MLDGDGQVTSVVEATELARLNSPALQGTSDGLLGRGSLLGLEEGGGLASDTHALLEDGCTARTENGLVRI